MKRFEQLEQKATWFGLGGCPVKSWLQAGVMGTKCGRYLLLVIEYFYLLLPGRNRCCRTHCFAAATVAARSARALRYPHGLDHKAPRIQNPTRIVLLANLVHQGSVLEVISPDVNSCFQRCRG